MMQHLHQTQIQKEQQSPSVPKRIVLGSRLINKALSFLISEHNRSSYGTSTQISQCHRKQTRLGLVWGEMRTSEGYNYSSLASV